MTVRAVPVHQAVLRRVVPLAVHRPVVMLLRLPVRHQARQVPVHPAQAVPVLQAARRRPVRLPAVQVHQAVVLHRPVRAHRVIALLAALRVPAAALLRVVRLQAAVPQAHRAALARHPAARHRAHQVPAQALRAVRPPVQVRRAVHLRAVVHPRVLPAVAHPVLRVLPAPVRPVAPVHQAAVALQAAVHRPVQVPAHQAQALPVPPAAARLAPAPAVRATCLWPSGCNLLVMAKCSSPSYC